MIPLGIISGGALFDATKWSGLVGWWDAQGISASDGATITTLTDYSYNSRNLTGSGTYTLNYHYGHPAVSGTFTTSNFVSSYSEFTMIYVGYVAVNAGNFFANTATAGYCMYTDGSTVRLHYPNVVWAAQANWGSRWARVVMTGGSSATSEYIYENNSQIAIGSGTTAAPGSNNLSLGGPGSYIGEAVFYNRVLTTQERTDIDAALALKWG